MGFRMSGAASLEEAECLQDRANEFVDQKTYFPPYPAKDEACFPAQLPYEKPEEGAK